MTYFLLVLGFAMLIKGAGFLVDGAASLAKRWGTSSLVIGLTIVAFGTSAPELIVNIFASLEGSTDIAIGNVVGSNIANIWLILGVSAVIFPLTVQKNTTWKEIPLSLLAIVIVFIMASDIALDKMGINALTRTDGLTLIAFFLIFLYYTYGISSAEGESNAQIKQYSGPLSVLMVLVGLALLVVGGKWIVDSAVEIALQLGASEALIGLTIVAVGTSLPELATSVVAAVKKQTDIAVGNVVGSNIFNIFWILGLSSVVKPLPFSKGLELDVAVCVFATLLLFLFMFVGKKHTLQRWQGIMFIIMYIGYIGYLVARG